MSRKRDTSGIKEKLKAAKEDQERQILNEAALDVQKMFKELSAVWNRYEIPD